MNSHSSVILVCTNDGLGCFFDDRVTVGAQSSHSCGSPMSQRECAGFNAPGFVVKDYLEFDPDSIVFDEEMLGLDITQSIELTANAIDRIRSAKPDIIIIDPLYVAVSGDLADGEAASKAMKWLLYIAVKCNAAVLVLHHSHRARYSQNGKKIDEDDDSYGSRWIQANVVIQYGVKSHSDGTAWRLVKDRYKQSRKDMTLAYDAETGLSSAEKNKASVRDEVMHFLQAHKPGASFTYPQLATMFGCAEGYLSHLMQEPRFRIMIKKEAPPGKPVKLVRIPCDFDNAVTYKPP